MAIKAQNNMETEVWGNVEIVCPICRSKKIINIPMRIIDESKQLTSLLIPSGRVCDHAFVPFIDKHLKVRGYQKLDVLLDEIEPTTELISELNPQDIDLFEIKMNLRPEIMIYAIRGSLLKKKILIIIDNDLEFLKDTLFDFFDYAFQKSFEAHILIHTKETYKISKKHYSEYLVLEGKGIIGKMKKSITINELKIEQEIIKEFFRESDSNLGLKNLRDKIREIYTLSNKLLEFYHKQGIDHPLQARKAIRYLEDTHFIKISKGYFKFLVEVVKYYFNTNIILVQDKLAEKIDNMWGL
ncbi:MAG: hypothetical protein ACFFHV_15130 [Promethearchaeota archaeon]